MLGSSLCTVIIILICALFVAHGHGHMRAAQTHHVSPDHMHVLRCDLPNATWSRAGDHPNRTVDRLPSGTQVRDGDLWFLPVDPSHHGTYTCEGSSTCDSSTCPKWTKTDQGGLEMKFMVSVSSGQCPHPAVSRTFTQGTTNSLPCEQRDILGLNKSTAHVSWLKDCAPLDQNRRSFEVDQAGRLKLYRASEDDAGIYTCLVNFTLDGQKHSSARSIRLHINTAPTTDFIWPPQLVYPINDTVEVELGSSAEVRCKAYLGLEEDEENFMYWLLPNVENVTFIESWAHVKEDDKVFGLSTLSISRVTPELLNVPIRCLVMNPIDQAEGWLWLKEADHTKLHTFIAVGLAFCLVVVLLLSAYYFRVDLVLAYRKLRPKLTKQIPDGKEYDAYVSYLHADSVSSSGTTSFALQVLPEVLEKQHGYSLYIRGRDDCPGEAVHDQISVTVRRCRRLIIILSADVQSCKSTRVEEEEEEVLPLEHSQNQNQNQNQDNYEQKIGLHDALMQNDPRVILVEMDGPVDYSCLSASLRYIRKQQGALRWSAASDGEQSCTTLTSNGHFWKCMRYNMPAVPGGRGGLTNTVV